MSISSAPVAPRLPTVGVRLLPTLKRGEMWRYFGPAFVASVAYIDPGNFAANIEGGSRFGYSLLWVLLWSNAMAILVQYLAAKLGIATGKTLPQNCRANFSRPINFGLWDSETNLPSHGPAQARNANRQRAASPWRPASQLQYRCSWN